MVGPPERIGKYAIVRRLGRGGMGEVWLGRHPDLDIPVAVKTLAPNLVDDDPSYVERFIQEARTAARLSHPNIVRILDAGSDGGVHHLVMEYVEGGSVRDALEQAKGPLPVARALAIAVQVARGLDAAARLAIIHRDIKPDNILLDADGTPKLADLGLAKQLGGRDGASLTHTGASVGTPGYISPEQAQDSKSVDARADIYSLGATLFHMVTGAPPYHGTSAFAVMMKHVSEPVPDPHTRNPSLSTGVCELLTQMLAKNPEARPQTAAEVVVRLERLVSMEAASPTPAGVIAGTAADAMAATQLSSGTDRAGPTIVVGGLPAGGFWRRAAAIAVDVVCVGVANAILGNTPGGFWVLLALYNAVALPRYGKTVGKHLMGLRVVGADDGPPSRRVALVRGFSYAISGPATLGLGCLWALRDSRGRALHDILAGTRVVLRS